MPNRVAAKWIRTEADRVAISEGCYFDRAAGQRVVDFIERYVTPSSGMLKDSGKPFKLLPWQRDLTMRLFSWMRPPTKESGGKPTRRYRTAYISCAKKNGKSFYCGCLSLYFLMADKESSPLVAVAATDTDVAKEVYKEIEYFAKANDRIRSATHFAPSLLHCSYPKGNGRIEILSSTPKHGLSCSCVILDEFAFFPANSQVFKTLKFAGRSRRQPLLIMITTSGMDRSTECYSQYLYARKILDGSCTDTSYFAEIYEAPETADIQQPDVWAMANPSIGETQNVDELKTSALAAKFSRRAEIDFRQLSLNQWCQSTDTHLNLDKWEACTLDPWHGIPAGSDIFIGLDLASSTDLCGLTIIAPLDGLYYVEAKAWTNTRAAQWRRKQNLTRYEDFVAEGTLTISDGDANDFPAIRQYIADLCNRYRVKGIYYDKNHGRDTAMIMQADRLPVFEVTPSRNYYTGPMRKLEELVLQEKLRHRGSKLLNWQAYNLMSDTDEQRKLVWPVKGKDSDSYDNMMALLYCLMPAVEAHVVPRKSIWDSRKVGWLQPKYDNVQSNKETVRV